MSRDGSQIYINDTGMEGIKSDRKSGRFSSFVLTGKRIQNTKRYNDKTMIRVTRHYLNTLSKILLGRTQQDTRTDKDTREAYRITVKLA